MDDLELSNEEIFNSALSDEPIETVEKTEPVADTRARDEHGRFVEKTEPEPKPEVVVTAKEEANVPSWRLKEIREERDQLRQMNAELQRRFQASQPKEPTPRPDIFEKPDEFVRQGVQEAVDPVNARVNSVVEFYSRRDAVKQHGEEKVTEAFRALDQAASRGDPMAIATVQAVKKSMDPFGEIVSWHVKNEVGADPDAFFQRKLEEALKDEKFKGELMSKLAPPEQEAKPVIKIPPSLSRVASAAAALEGGGDLSNASIFANI